MAQRACEQHNDRVTLTDQKDLGFINLPPKRCEITRMPTFHSGVLQCHGFFVKWNITRRRN